MSMIRCSVCAFVVTLLVYQDAFAQSSAGARAREAQAQRQINSINRQQLADPAGAARRSGTVRRDIIRNQGGVNFDARSRLQNREIRAIDNSVESGLQSERLDALQPERSEIDTSLPSSLDRESAPLPSMQRDVDRIATLVNRASAALDGGRIQQSRSDLELSKAFLGLSDPEELSASQREALRDYEEQIEALETELDRQLQAQ